MKNSDELKRINPVNTGVSAILLASDSGLQTVSICGQDVLQWHRSGQG
jgi:hypothetical protein